MRLDSLVLLSSPHPSVLLISSDRKERRYWKIFLRHLTGGEVDSPFQSAEGTRPPPSSLPTRPPVPVSPLKTLESFSVKPLPDPEVVVDVDVAEAAATTSPPSAPGSDYLRDRPSLPVGARLLQFSLQWHRLITDSWVLDKIDQGLRISFSSPPPLTSLPRWTRVPSDPSKALALRTEVQSLLDKAAVEILPPPYPPGFFSTLFLVPKPDGRWRPVIDLSTLNLFIVPPPFKMETIHRLWGSLLLEDWATSIDLTDAYFHVPMHISTRRYLRFAIDGVVYTFKALPFGLNTAPWAFTRILDSVMVAVRKIISSQISNYLDDILIKNLDREILLRDLHVVQSILYKLGFIQNLKNLTWCLHRIPTLGISL